MPRVPCRSSGYSDRTVLKDTLSLVLAKTPDEKHLFDECFDLYFKRDELAAGRPRTATPTGQTPHHARRLRR